MNFYDKPSRAAKDFQRGANLAVSLMNCKENKHIDLVITGGAIGTGNRHVFEGYMRCLRQRLTCEKDYELGNISNGYKTDEQRIKDDMEKSLWFPIIIIVSVGFIIISNFFTN